MEAVSKRSISVFDKAKAESFAGYTVGLLNSGFLILMISIGHKTGLFDTMATLEPSTSEQIARKAKLNERYVREWLGAMVTGKVIEYDSSNGTYKLPAEHAAAITRAAGIDNLATTAQYLSLCGEVEDQVADCFRKGGGVPYSAYPRFTELMSEGSSKVQDARLVDTILPLVDGLVDRLREGISVLDVGCGSGHAINLMAKAFPNSKFIGYDFSKKAIAAAKAEAKRLQLQNARFAAKDVATLNEPKRYDLITAFDSIHDQAKPTKVLKAISKGVQPDGVFLLVDVAASSNLQENLQHPLGPFLYSVSTMHCMTVSLAYRGEGLGTVWGEQLAKQKLREAGFKSVEIRRVLGDILNNYYIARKT
jgi:2-polyprenyl-3-methyl-5-hydroxy-6-metoxy-1,4-benzoquinol methylase